MVDSNKDSNKDIVNNDANDIGDASDIKDIRDIRDIKDTRESGGQGGGKKPFHKNNFALRRSRARFVAIQGLYQYDFYQGECDLEAAVDDLLTGYIRDALLFPEGASRKTYKRFLNISFIGDLIAGCVDNLEEIDKEVGDFLKEGWTITKISDIMRQILRCATCELKYMEYIPAKVIIDEYVDLAACFYDQVKVNFANGVLDNLAKKLRPQGLEYSKPREEHE